MGAILRKLGMFGGSDFKTCGFFLVDAILRMVGTFDGSGSKNGWDLSGSDFKNGGVAWWA